MAKTKHYRATVNLLRPFFTGRPQQFKIKIAGGYVYVENNNYFYFDGEETKQLEQLDEQEGLEVFIYTETNRFLLEEFTPEERTPEREWVVEPLEVKTEEGETVGGVGTIYDEVTKSNLVIYLSADGTASTITLWERGSQEEKDLALQDLKSLSDALLELINTLANQND